MKPKKVSKVDLYFGPENLTDYIPNENDIPKEFRKFNNKYSQFVSNWFFFGLAANNSLKAKSGVDKAEALNHIKTILSSDKSCHEHKIAGCAYLLSLWFDL